MIACKLLGNVLPFHSSRTRHVPPYIVDTLVVFHSTLEPVAIFELEFTFSAGWIIMLRFYNRVIFTRVTWFLGVSSCT